MNYLYIIEPPIDETSSTIAPSGKTVILGEYDGMLRFLSAVELSAGTLVGKWQNDGSVDSINVPLYEKHFKSFQNGEDGEATDSLNFQYFQGHHQRQMQEAVVENTLAVYPSDKQPFVVTMQRYEDTKSVWPGWYWRFIVEFSDPERSPKNRTVGIYDKNWNYLYTVGALVEKPYTSVSVDEDPPTEVMKYTGACPPGFQTTKPEDIYYALLHGAAQEGRMILPAAKNEQQSLFWEK